jgi:glucokinase
LILNGRLFRGRDNVAGEFGHIPLNESGPRCNCGGVACIEAYIGNKKILKEAERVFKRGISLEELSARAHSGDKRASGIWREAGRKLGIALCAAINLLNLDAVIVGGGIAGAGKPLFGSIRDTIKKRAMGPQSRRVRLFKSGLGGDAGLLGAALLVKRKGSVG